MLRRRTGAAFTKARLAADTAVLVSIAAPPVRAVSLNSVHILEIINRIPSLNSPTAEPSSTGRAAPGSTRSVVGLRAAEECSKASDVCAVAVSVVVDCIRDCRSES